MQLIKIIIAAGCFVLCGACAPLAEPKTASDAAESPESSVTATIRESRADGAGDVVGIVQFQTSPYGLLIVPNLHGLGPGPHALHMPFTFTKTRTVVPVPMVIRQALRARTMILTVQIFTQDRTRKAISAIYRISLSRRMARHELQYLLPDRPWLTSEAVR